MSSNTSTTQLGQFGEALAQQALSAHQYQIIECNHRSPAGEIDIIARDGECWVFVEVKLRRGDAYGSPEDAVNPAKQKRLLNAGALYMQNLDLADAEWRIDVVAIDLTHSGKVKPCDCWPNRSW
jgi:putative endonuclease